jgi:hypothetical protein
MHHNANALAIRVLSPVALHFVAFRLALSTSAGEHCPVLWTEREFVDALVMQLPLSSGVVEIFSLEVN